VLDEGALEIVWMEDDAEALVKSCAPRWVLSRTWKWGHLNHHFGEPGLEFVPPGPVTRSTVR
jgi:hypothetical protein